MDLATLARHHFDGLRAGIEELDLAALERAGEALLGARDAGRRVFVLGNGGSAATASHLACDLADARRAPGVPRCRAMALADNPAIVTARANDASFARVFLLQLETHLEPEDVVVAISVSGDSENLLLAVDFTRAAGGVTVGLLGSAGGKLGSRVDHPVVVASRDFGVVESLHLSLCHLLSDRLRRA